jgi:hypothetical protein
MAGRQPRPASGICCLDLHHRGGGGGGTLCAGILAIYRQKRSRIVSALEGLNERDGAPDPTVVARLSELDIPLPAHPSPADKTVALLDS